MINTEFLFTMGIVDINLRRRLCAQVLRLLVSLVAWVLSALVYIEHISISSACWTMHFDAFAHIFINILVNASISCVHTLVST